VTTKCPQCFTKLDPDTRLYQCAGPCEAHPDEARAAYTGRPLENSFPRQWKNREGQRNWQPPKTIPCYVCEKPMSEICPTCHFLLPAQWREGSAICIAMAGARATGKTLYLGVVVRQIEQMLLAMGSLLSFATPASEECYRKVYEDSLYVNRAIFDSTDRVGESANAYQLVPLMIRLGVVDGVPRYLVLRDVAGEDLEAPRTDMTYLSYFGRADAVFFLFDPTAIPRVREMLRGVVPEQLMQSGNPQTVLTNLLSIIGESSPPIAMILSKFDTLQKLRNHHERVWSNIMSNHGAACQRDPGGFAPRYDSADGTLLHLEARSLLELLGATAFINAMTNPPRGRPYTHRYFTISALGSAPDGPHLHPHGIAPFRCLDPVRWALSLNRLI
jgi:hypothetical protein